MDCNDLSQLEAKEKELNDLKQNHDVRVAEYEAKDKELKE